jgi:hypothetical protein
MEQSISTKLAERGSFVKRRLAANVAFTKTPSIEKILKTVDYIADKYKLEIYADVATYGSYVYLTARGLTGLKDEKLAAMLDTLVHSDPAVTSSSDYPSSFSRSYSFSWIGEQDSHGYIPELTIAVTASFSEDSETCKRVIVGYKEPPKEPTPIYELQCSDAPTPVEQE